jgi:predicted TIM-barrel fold metal-dependent hydrolase
MLKHWCITLLLAAGVSGTLASGPRPASAQATAPAPTAQKARYRLSDCHLHLVDFLQKSDGAKAVIQALDRAGVDQAQITGMPLVKQWTGSEPVQPGYYLDDDGPCYWYSATDVLVAREVQALPQKDRKRLHPFICGFNSADRNAVDHVRRMIEWYPGFWKGIGEVMGRHDDLTALTYGDRGKADHVALDAIYELAAEHGLPVSVHNNISSVWKREPLYVGEMEAALKKHPNTKFIWCHAGISRRINVPTLLGELRRMVGTYPNLRVDLSWVVFEEYIAKNGALSSEWVSLIEAFPDRFMIGSDKVGKFHNYEPEMQKYYLLLDSLKPETARKVGRDNFLLTLPKEGATIKGKR